MKQLKQLLIIIFIVIISSCNKSVTDSKEYTIVGKWSFSSATFERILTTNSVQTAKIPYTGIGHITVSGNINTILGSIYIYSYDPLTIVVQNYDYLVLDDSGTGTFISPLNEKTFIGNINYTFDGVTLSITESTLTNQDDAGETVLVGGDISFETINIPVNSPTTIAIPPGISTYPPRYMQYEFREDGTFIQTVNENDGSVTSLGTWEGSGNTITTTITEGDYTEVHIIEYSIEGNILTGIEKYDLCQSDDQCLGYYEVYYQIDNGSLDSIRMTSSIVFRAVTDI